MSERIYLLLGSNEGNRQKYLQDAAEALLRGLQGSLFQSSEIYETAAWGLEDQPPFLNQAVSFETAAEPEVVLACIREVESGAERQRRVRWGQRTLDVDILLFGNRIVNTTELQIPHPQLQNRRFALVPLADIAAGVVHPLLEKSVAGLLAECPDQLAVTAVSRGPRD